LRDRKFRDISVSLGTLSLMQNFRTQLVERGTQVVNSTIDSCVRVVPGGSFLCPVCNVSGRLSTSVSVTGARRWARCPRCGSMERHRLQTFALNSRVLPALAGRNPRVLHIAPEASIAAILVDVAASYTSADFSRTDVDLQIDLRDSGLPDASYDLVYASHVLEHIDRDRDAIREIRRILAPGGLAVLPVPLVSQTTIEYPQPAPLEAMHVRAPGTDYFDRYRSEFSRVDVVTSLDAPTEIQPFVFEDRSQWPTKKMPWRTASPGRFHLDAVPLCWV
jgi:SAM-dependent methyltransferase